MSDEERLPLTSVPAGPLSRAAKWKYEIAELLESAEFHWTIIGLTSADALFVIAEVSWDLFMEDKCSPEVREEPPIIHMCALLSLIVTCCFTLEIPLAIFAFGLRYYKRLLHAFDALVVIATFVLEVGLHGQESQIAGLLVLLRLWRLLKLATSITVTSEEYHETSADSEIAQLKKELLRVRSELGRAKREVEGLRRRSGVGVGEGEG